MKLNWRPTGPQRKFKAKAYREHRSVDFRELTPQQLQTLTGNRSVQSWLENPDFADWFFNPDYNKQMMEAGVEAAVQALIEIIEEPDMGPRGIVTAASKVAAADKLLSYAGYQPVNRKEVVYKDADIDKMGEAELREFIQRSIKDLNGKRSETDEDPDPRH